MKPPSYTSRRGLLNRFIGWAVCRATPGFGLLPSAAPSAAADLSPPLPEGLSEAESRAVEAVLDGTTLRLAGGDELRCAGIEAPNPALGGDAAMAALAAAAKQALGALLGSPLEPGPVTLRYDTARRDRYGRILAQVCNAEGRWLQAALVEAGHARVHGDGRNRRGLRTLLALEAAARAAGRGLWRHPALRVQAASDPLLGRRAGSFQIVAGRVFAAAIVKDAGYANFGADRATDLTLVLKKPALTMMQAAMIDFPGIAGKAIRCRGWLELHDGPSIDISHPEQIEILE